MATAASDSHMNMQAYSVLATVQKADPTHELGRRQIHVRSVLLATRPTDTIQYIERAGGSYSV